MTKVRLLDAGPEGYVEWELDVTDFYANLNGCFSKLTLNCYAHACWYVGVKGVMHGGAAGVIFGMFVSSSHIYPGIEITDMSLWCRYGDNYSFMSTSKTRLLGVSLTSPQYHRDWMARTDCFRQLSRRCDEDVKHLIPQGDSNKWVMT